MPWVSRKKMAAMQQTKDELIASVESLKNHAFLIGIERKGRENIFTFARGTAVHQVTTMGLISDDIRQWKQDLLS